MYPAKPLIPILGGLLTFESEWSPTLGPSFEKALTAEVGDGRLDLGCVASHGHFFFDQTAARYTFVDGSKPATAFLFKLISQLQFSGTAPMIDVEAYGQYRIKLRAFAALRDQHEDHQDSPPTTSSSEHAAPNKHCARRCGVPRWRRHAPAAAR